MEDFDYQLPPELIAQHPAEQRDQSRLLVVERHGSKLEHRRFHQVVEYLRPGDALVVNDSRVIRARLTGTKTTGGKVEVFLLTQVGPGCWEVLVRPGKRVPPGAKIRFGPELEARVVEKTGAGGRVVEFSWNGDWDRVLESVGEVPLPPYIRAPVPDPERYQTVYAKEPGSVAAPTAGLHFTPELLRTVEEHGVRVVQLTLHVGPGTFRPVTVSHVDQHVMHGEHYRVTPQAATVLNQVRESGGRWWAVGTTVTRTLETITGPDRRATARSGWTTLFIYPGHDFKAVDALITNFHLPRSTLLMLVSAFAGRDTVMRAYQEAVAQRYRFYSFGDAMLLI